MTFGRTAVPGLVLLCIVLLIRAYKGSDDYSHIPSAKAAHVIMLPLQAVEDFKPELSGRPRTSVPVWEISPEGNTVIATSILVRIRSHQYAKLMTKLEEIRREKHHLFSGTLARYVIEKKQHLEHLEILLIWRDTAMPEEATYNQ